MSDFSGTGFIVNFIHDYQGAQLIFAFDIPELGEGETGNSSVVVTVSGDVEVFPPVLAISPEGACTADVTEHSLLDDSGVGGAVYLVVASGACTQPFESLFGQPTTLELPEFELAGVTVWFQ